MESGLQTAVDALDDVLEAFMEVIDDALETALDNSPDEDASVRIRALRAVVSNLEAETADLLETIDPREGA